MKRILYASAVAAAAVAVATMAGGASSALAAPHDYPASINGRLVFQSESVAGDHTQNDLYTVQPNGSDPRRLTNTPDFHEFGPSGFFDVGPCISPDGRFIAFGSDRAGTFLDDLWVVQVNGLHLRRPLSAPGSEAFCDWQKRRA